MSTSSPRVIALLLCLLISLSPAALGRQTSEPVRFSLRDIDGGTVSDDDVRGEVTVFLIGASWLPLTERQSADIRGIAEEFGHRGVAFYLVSTESESPRSRNYASDEQLRQFTRKHDLPFRVLRDPGGRTLRRYRMNQIPVIVVLDRQGRVDGKPMQGYGPKGSLYRTLREQLGRLIR